jgi:hypothetical protein
MSDMTQAALDVLAERRRQIEAEGWTPEHDDQHSNWELSRAAICYGDMGGMTLRDYMAIHSTQPGVAEILTAAGLGEMSGIAFHSWWARLTNEERFALTSKVRYQQADAMLKARRQHD